jgi:hypothetical protein
LIIRFFIELTQFKTLKNKIISFQQLGSHLGENHWFNFQPNYHQMWYLLFFIVKTDWKIGLRTRGPNENHPTLHFTTIKRVAKSLGIDEFKIGFKLENKFNQMNHLWQQNGKAFYFYLLFFKKTFHVSLPHYGDVFMFDVVFFSLIEWSSSHIFWLIMIFCIVGHFSPHMLFLYFVFFHKDFVNLCKWNKV